MPDMPQKKSRVLVKLFLSTLYLSAFTFGGGYVIVPLMRREFVLHRHWIEDDEMLDLTAIAQSTPGAMAVNAAVTCVAVLMMQPAFWPSASAETTYRP